MNAITDPYVRPEDLLTRIKEETAERHRRIERRVTILDPNLGLGEYRRWLQRLLGFYEPVEQGLEPWARSFRIDWAARRRTDLLRGDLARLGLGDDAVRALPRCRELASVGDASEAWGRLYVLEGAALGGRIIARHLHQHLGLDASNGAAFYVGHGAMTEDMWRSFRQRIVADVRGHEAIARAIAAAQALFDAFDAWLANGIVGSS